LIALTYRWGVLLDATDMCKGGKEGNGYVVSGSSSRKMTGKAGPSSHLGPGSRPKNRVRKRESGRSECVLEMYRQFGGWDGWG
jgi:hypothetical protein